MSRMRCGGMSLPDGRAFEIARLPGRQKPVLLVSTGEDQGWSVAARFTSDEAADAITEILGDVVMRLSLAEGK